jgi:DNA-binding FrmR family transcriptional regulator
LNRKTKDSSLAAGEKTHREQLPRLRRIEGQVRGLQQMIENERDCLDVTHQISATINALRRVQVDMLQMHLAALGEMVVGGNLTPSERRSVAEEIARHLRKLT